MIDPVGGPSSEEMAAEGDPIEAERVRAEVRCRLFGGERPAIRVGRFELGARLGTGGMGVVYLGHDRELGRRVAIKLLLDGLAHRDLVREAQALAKLRHPNVVSVHEIGSWRALPFVAMEYVEGQTLRAWLAARRRSWREIAAVFAGAGRGLAAAHAAGLVHRDFKLDNVLVDRGGQALVVDFGLARPVHDGDRDELDAAARAARGSPAGLAPEVTGTVAGTPAYMAPEVLLGAPATPRSDQFSFGVALYEALAGRRPFVAPAAEGILAAIRRRGHAAIAGVPRRLRLAVERCLEEAPERRHADLAEVVAVLDAGSRSTRRAVAVVAGAVAITTAVVSYAWIRGGDLPVAADPCAGAGAALAGVWSEPRRAAMKAAFTRSGLPYAADALARADEALGAYAARWTAMAEEVCRATNQRSQPEALLALRAGCLDDRRREIGALIVRLGEADAVAVERAVAGAAALPAIEGCADTGRLAERTPLPQAPAVVASIASVRDRLAVARAGHRSGHAAEALAATRALLAEVEPIAYAPLSAEAHLLLGSSAVTAGDLEAAAPALERAYREGLAGRHDLAAAEAAIVLAQLHGHVRARPDEGRRWAADAEAMLRRIGGAPELAAALENVVGNIEQTAGNYDLALAAFERSESAWRSATGDQRLAIATALQNAGNSLVGKGRSVDALAKLVAARSLMTEAVGAGHPYVAGVTTNLTAALRDLGRFDEALVLDEGVLAHEEARAGPDHPDVAFAHGAVGNDLRGLGRFVEAIEHYRKAQSIFGARLGADHPTVASSQANIGAALLSLGRYDDAERQLRAALASKEKMGAHHPRLITTLDNLGTLALRRGRGADARRWFQRSLAIGEAALGPDSPDLADSLAGLGEAALLDGDARGARALLERALALRARTGVATDVAGVHFPLGRALWQLGERAAGRRLVGDALAVFGGPYHAFERAQAKAWLARHPAP